MDVFWFHCGLGHQHRPQTSTLPPVASQIMAVLQECPIQKIKHFLSQASVIAQSQGDYTARQQAGVPTLHLYKLQAA